MPSKPNQTTKEDPICLHGRDTWKDDCGMCDASSAGEVALSSLAPADGMTFGDLSKLIEAQSKVPDDKLKMWILVRKDLNMRKGKMIAQSGHGVLEGLFGDVMNSLATALDQNPDAEHVTAKLEMQATIIKWWTTGQTKITIGAKSEQDLFDTQKAVNDRGIRAIIIQDNGLTEFKGKTYTVCVLGPCRPSQVKDITDKFDLL